MRASLKVLIQLLSQLMIYGKDKMQILEIHDLLKNVSSKSYSEDDIKKSLKSFKFDFVKRKLEKQANEIWCLESVLKIQVTYLKAFTQLKEQRYYDAWCSFEQIKLALNFLSPHFKTDNDDYMLSFIGKHTNMYQELYPYKIFPFKQLLNRLRNIIFYAHIQACLYFG